MISLSRAALFKITNLANRGYKLKSIIMNKVYLSIGDEVATVDAYGKVTWIGVEFNNKQSGGER